MSNKIIEDLKWNYNYYLMRYEKGCKYLEKNPSETEKWLSNLLEILDNLNTILEELIKNTEVSDLEILKGFKLEGEKR